MPKGMAIMVTRQQSSPHLTSSSIYSPWYPVSFATQPKNKQTKKNWIMPTVWNLWFIILIDENLLHFCLGSYRHCKSCIRYTAILRPSHLLSTPDKISNMTDVLQKGSFYIWDLFQCSKIFQNHHISYSKTRAGDPHTSFLSHEQGDWWLLKDIVIFIKSYSCL